MGFGTIFFIVLAAIILFQLRNVLGRRTGNERPPFDPYSRRDPGRPVESAGNVVTLPGSRGPVPGGAPARTDYSDVDKVAEPGTPLNDALRRIKDADANFGPKAFIDGAKLAYEMIVTAFAEGDRKMLRSLLSDEVYKGFESAIAEREARGERMQSSFVGVDKAEIVSAELKDREAIVTLRIVSELISAVLGPNGEVIDGDPETVVEVTDRWTFARDTRSRDPNWKLIETESEE